jgi:Transposase DDE domain
LQDLPSETIAMAYEFKAFTRARKIKTPQQLLRAVLLYCGLDQSLRAVAGTMTLLGPRLTDSALAERLAACRPWVKALLPKMIAHRPVTSLPPKRRFIVIDGIHYRLHLGLDLVTLELTHLHISDAQTGESLRRFALGPADIAVADRGYCHPTAVAATVQAGAHLVVRLNPYNMPLSQPDETPLDLVQALQQHAPCTLHSLPVRVGPTTQRVTGWVHAYRLSEEQANKARAVCRQRNSKKGHTPQASTLFLAGWVLVWTSLPPDVLRAETVLQLYRVRWQVELAIKRCKSLLDLDALRARQGSPLADLWLHGKMLYALLVDKRMRRTMGASWGHLDRVRTATWWRPWKLIQQTLLPRLTGALHWADPHWSHGRAVMAERPRRRTLQRLPEVLVTTPSWVDSALLPLGEEGEEPIAA